MSFAGITYSEKPEVWTLSFFNLGLIAIHDWFLIQNFSLQLILSAIAMLGMLRAVEIGIAKYILIGVAVAILLLLDLRCCYIIFWMIGALALWLTFIEKGFINTKLAILHSLLVVVCAVTYAWMPMGREWWQQVLHPRLWTLQIFLFIWICLAINLAIWAGRNCYRWNLSVGLLIAIVSLPAVLVWCEFSLEKHRVVCVYVIELIVVSIIMAISQFQIVEND